MRTESYAYIEDDVLPEHLLQRDQQWLFDGRKGFVVLMPESGVARLTPSIFLTGMFERVYGCVGWS